MKMYIFYVLLAIGSLSKATTNNLHRYMWANYKQFSGGTSHEIQEWYNGIFSSAKPSIFTNKGYLYFLRDHGNYQRIVELMPQLATPFKDDPDIQLTFVVALKRMNKTQEANDLLISLSREFKTHAEIIFQAAETMVQRKEMNNALSLIDDYLNSAARRPHNFIFHFLKGQIYTHLQDFKQAQAQIELCLDAHPRFPQGWLLLAMIEEQQGKFDNAIKGYSSYLELAGSNKQIEQHILDLALKQKSAQHNQQLLFVNQSRFAKSLILFERKQYQPALAEINQCLAQDQHDAQARLLKIQILAALEQFDDLIKTVVAWIQEEPDNALWYQTLHLLSRKNIPTIRVINALTSIATQQPKKLLPLLYLADLHTRSGTIDQAIQYHQTAKNLVQDPQLKLRLLYQLALLHYERNEHPQMLTVFNEIDQLAQPCCAADNLRAYYYATAGNDLAQAQHYFDKAYALDRGNPYFLDTQAVIFYKQHKYDKALQLLKPLAQKFPHDSTILIHLAKTYHHLGDLNIARTMIDQAQQYAQTTYEKKTSTQLASTWKNQ